MFIQSQVNTDLTPH